MGSFGQLPAAQVRLSNQDRIVSARHALLPVPICAWPDYPDLLRPIAARHQEMDDAADNEARLRYCALYGARIEASGMIAGRSRQKIFMLGFIQKGHFGGFDTCYRNQADTNKAAVEQQHLSLERNSQTFFYSATYVANAFRKVGQKTTYTGTFSGLFHGTFGRQAVNNSHG